MLTENVLHLSIAGRLIYIINAREICTNGSGRKTGVSNIKGKRDKKRRQLINISTFFREHSHCVLRRYII